jgi:hypothetical protein
VLKAKIREGRTTVVEALDRPEAAGMAVFDLVRAQHRWGRARTLRLLVRVPLSERREVRDLTERQRGVLVDELGRFEVGPSGGPG